MKLDPLARERAANVTSVLADGNPVDPWLVEIDLRTASPDGRPIELRLGVAILLFELRQSSVSVTEEDLVRFVDNDIRMIPERALAGYLVIARHVIKPLPKVQLGWFARLLASPRALPRPAPKWKWRTVESVSLMNDEILMIRGACDEVKNDE